MQNLKEKTGKNPFHTTDSHNLCQADCCRLTFIAKSKLLQVALCLRMDIHVMKNVRGLHIILVLYRNLKSLWLQGRKLAMADATKTTAHPIDHITYTQGPVMC